MKTDIEIAQQTEMKHISQIAANLGLKEEDYEPYGHHKAKLSSSLLKKLDHLPDGKVILVTSINPTPAGEGKSTVTVGLGQALNRIGKKAVIALREPSLGPVMGIKGGAAGGGYSQVLPMEDINLHFTGDLHAITSANNLLAALIDNHIQQGNDLKLDARRIVWRRVLDMNDRALRETVIGLGGSKHGVPREEGFMITVASEIMAILCLSKDLQDLKERVAKIVIGYTYEEIPVTAGDLGAEGALAALLKDAVKPNLVQTTENTPAIIHGGPFANIAHGCNSIIATKTAAKLGEYVVTEAGFGADLGAEKFLNIKTASGDIRPHAVVIVATVRALKMHGGLRKEELNVENIEALELGMENLKKHMETIGHFGLPYVIAINKFPTDTNAETAFVLNWCRAQGADAVLTEVWAHGGEGGIALAKKITAITEQEGQAFQRLYNAEETLEAKIKKIATLVYGADDIEFSPEAAKQMEFYERQGWGTLPVCMAKTQYSLSDKPALLGRPTGFKISIRELKPAIGAGFIVALTGDVMTMPGLPKMPAALRIDVDGGGNMKGLF